MWCIKYSKQAVKDSRKIEQAHLKQSAVNLINVLKTDPFKTPPPFEKLIGDLSGKFSRRINIQHRLIYEVFEEENTVRILRMWTHYE